jgi:hypothetical protein
MKFNDWLKGNHQFKDVGKPVKIGKHNATLYYDVYDGETRHWRVEIEDIGNVGRSHVSAEEAIIDAKATLGEK